MKNSRVAEVAHALYAQHEQLDFWRTYVFSTEF